MRRLLSVVCFVLVASIAFAQQPPTTAAPAKPVDLIWGFNSGGVVTAESGKDAHTAHITVYHDAQHPSALAIPVVK